MQQVLKTPLWKHAIACLLAGAATTLAFAPYTYSYIAVLTMAVLFYSWSKTGARTALLTGYLFGLGLFGTGLSWLHISINLFGDVSLAGAWLLTFLLVAFLALYPALAGYLGRRLSDKPAIMLLLCLPAAWTLAEWLRGWLLTGFPWLGIGYSQIDNVLVNIAPVMGVYAVSWIVCFMASLLVLFVSTGNKQKPAIVVTLAIIITSMLTLSYVQWTQDRNDNKSVALVQGAIPQAMKWRPEQRQKTIELYTSLTSPYWNDSDLIIWPETAIPLLYHQAIPLIEALQEKARSSRADLLTGFAIKDLDHNKYFNSIIVIGRDIEMYNKRHLVPFGEYLPLDSLLRPLLHILSIPMSDFSAGDSRPLLQAGGIPVGVSICYEDIFGEEVIDALPDAGILINVSNDAWFGDSLAPHQHLQMARMRAKETGRYLLRSTNTGISAIIDEEGKIAGRSPQFKADVLHARVKSFSGETPYSRFGNTPVIIFMLLLIGMAVFIGRRSY